MRWGTRFRLEIECDNDAFQPDPTVELERLLRTLSATIVAGTTEQFQCPIRDGNGNSVGAYWFAELAPCQAEFDTREEAESHEATCGYCAGGTENPEV